MITELVSLTWYEALAQTLVVLDVEGGKYQFNVTHIVLQRIFVDVCFVALSSLPYRASPPLPASQY